MGQGVECFVFDDGYANMAGPSRAILLPSADRACIPDQTASGTCRRWFGRCQTTDASHVPVTFRTFETGTRNVSTRSDAIFLNREFQMCIPDQTAAGTCREWFGLGELASGGAVQCRVFDDGPTNLSGLTSNIATQVSFDFSGTGNPGRLCIGEGATLGFLGITGTCRRWFGECVVAGCGDGFCSRTENPSTCPADCRCGDGVCSVGESALSCPSDCPARCGDGICSSGENASNCPADCPPTCGDKFCNGNETPATCPADCPPPATAKTCSGLNAAPGATNYLVGVKDANGCAVYILAAFANSQGEAERCVRAVTSAWLSTVSSPVQVTATFHTDPTYGCASLEVSAFSDADAASCASFAGYSLAGPCP